MANMTWRAFAKVSSAINSVNEAIKLLPVAHPSVKTLALARVSLEKAEMTLDDEVAEQRRAAKRMISE